MNKSESQVKRLLSVTIRAKDLFPIVPKGYAICYMLYESFFLNIKIFSFYPYAP